jgi:hypothetical protein
MIATQQAKLQAAKLAAEATVVEAEARIKAETMMAQLLEKHPALLQLKLAELQMQALGRSSVTVVSESLGQSPYALGAQGLWPAGGGAAAGKK